MVPNADTSKTATANVQIGSWALLEGPAGLQFFDADGKGSPITIFTHADILNPNNGCYHSSVQRDLMKFVCVNFASDGPSVINLYQTDGTAGGTKEIGTIDFTLAKYGSLGQITYPAWSPVGKKLLFVSSDAGSVRSVSTICADGTAAPVDLFNEAPSMIGMPAPHFTPDNLSITFYNVTDGTMWIMGADGTNPHQLINAPSLGVFYTKDMKTMYYYNHTGVYVNGVADSLYPGFTLIGLSPDEKYLLLQDFRGDINGPTYGLTFLGTVDGETPTPFGAAGGWGSWGN